jgi:hypothetical protein
MLLQRDVDATEIQRAARGFAKHKNIAVGVTLREQRN